MGYKLIACDLDETLLNDQHHVGKRNVEAIQRARKEYGVKFVPATGRGFMQIQPELKELQLYDFYRRYSHNILFLNPTEVDTPMADIYNKCF